MKQLDWPAPPASDTEIRTMRLELAEEPNRLLCSIKPYGALDELGYYMKKTVQSMRLANDQIARTVI
jgi:hypothetical protein